MGEPQLNTSQGITDSAANEAGVTARTLISGVSQADRGWILGFICVVSIIVISDMFSGKWAAEASKVSNLALAEYIVSVESNRSQALERQASFFADQNRRSQEIIRDLVQAVSRDSERAGVAALSAIKRQSEAQTNQQWTYPRTEAPKEEGLVD